MDKDEKLYKEKYGDVPKDTLDRLTLLLSEIKVARHREMIMPMINRALDVKWSDDFEFIIYLEPKATPRPRYSSVSRVFYVKGSADNKKRFKKFLSGIEYEVIDTPTIFYCDAYLPFPSAMNKVEKVLAEMGLIRPVGKPDFDNIAKTYSDMIQEGLLIDDSYIIESRIRKYYSSKPRVEIKLKYLLSHDSDFNEMVNYKNRRKEESK